MVQNLIKASTRIMIVIIFIISLTTILVAQMANFDIPNGGNAGIDSNTIRVNDLAPDACNGIMVFSLLTGSNITGTTANELIIGTTGNDTLSGGGGNDCILGGGGDDTLDGGDGTDVCIEGAGVNTMTGCEY